MSFADDFDAAATKPRMQVEDISNNPAEIAKYASNPRVEISGTGNSFADAFDSVVPAKVPEAAATPQRSLAGKLTHQLGLTARAGATAITGLPNMLGDAANSLINLGTSAANTYAGTSIPQLQLPSEATQQLMDKAGVAQPENGTERTVQSIASSMAGVAPSVGLGKLLAGGASQTAKAIGTGLQQAPGMQMLGSAGAGAGGGIAAEHGAGMLGQFLAGMGGGLAGVAGASGVTAAARRMSAPNQQQMMAQFLKDQANNTSEPKPRIKLNVDGSQTPVVPSQAPAEFAPPSTSLSASPVSTEQQMRNIQVMRDIGLNEQRPSAVSGNKFDAGMEYENGLLKNSVGQVTRDQLAKEQAALKGYGQQLIGDTGAAARSPEEVGQSIKAPMRALSDHFDAQIGNLYKEADAKAGGLPTVQLDGMGQMLDTNSIFAGKAENSALRRGVRAYMKEQEIVTKDGLQPIDVQAAEGLRKYLNGQWSPQNSGLVGKIKEALDLDVSKTAGGDVYKQARALHAERKNTLDNPNGIAKIMQEEGPGGINQAVPDEKVGQRVLALPTNQFAHILETLKALPPELQGQGQQAIAEMRGTLAKHIYAAGDSGGTQQGPSVWNAAKVTKALNDQKSKMELLFDKDSLSKFETLHDAGHILQTPMAYKGAAAQGYNYLQKGVLTGLPAAGAGIGAYLGGPAGSMVGSGLGAGASMAAKSKIDASMAQKLAEMLRNPQPQFSK